MIPFTFGPSGKQLVGIHHAPAPARALGAGVVLCNPIGYEAMCAHRAYRHLARRLAADGFDVLRFDYYGTGDSSGPNDEPSRLRAWLDSIRAAVDELRAIAGVSSVDLFGVRLGGTLAVLAAGGRRDIRSLVLWAPPISGRAYVRQARALQMLQGGGSPVQSAADADRAPALGYPFDAPTLRELSAIDLLALRDRVAERALVLPRDDLPAGEKELAAHLKDCGIETEFRAVTGYARMMDHPETADVPTAALDAIAVWLRPPGERVVPGRPPSRIRPAVLTAWSQPPRRAVREEALTFGDGDRLVGILAERDGAASVGTPAVVFLNAGANHRVGPNRLYVSLARELAARGYPAFRFDVGGLGDGGLAPGMTENQVYSKASVADVQAALTFLTNIRRVQRFVLVGICSGGFLAFHTSHLDVRIVGQVVINSQTFEWRKGDSLQLSLRRNYKSTRYYLQALRRPAVWRIALRGKLDVRGVARTLRRRATTKVSLRLRNLASRLRGLPEQRTDVERVFREVSSRGVRSLLVYSSNDGGLDMIEEHLGSGARSMRAYPTFRLEIVDGADHTFTPPEAQCRLNDLIVRFVESAWPADAPVPVDLVANLHHATSDSSDTYPETEALTAAPYR